MFVKRFSFLSLLLLLLVTACSSTPVAPLAPGDLSATPNGNSILLKWKDNSNDELGFSVYRADISTLSTANLSTQNLVNTEQLESMQKLVELPANTTTYEDTSIMPGKRYRYAVTARGQSAMSAVSTTEISAPVLNNAPVANDLSITTSEEATVSITLTGSDTEGDSLTFTVLTQPANGSLSGTAPTLMYTPDTNFVGTDSFTFSVNDGEQNSNIATVSITVTNTNDAPVFTSTPVTEATENKAYSYAITTEDVDTNDSLSITATTKPTWLSLTDNGDGTATLSGSPTRSDLGEHSIVLEVSDGTTTTTQSYTLNVVEMITQVAAGSGFSMALKGDGTVVVWGKPSVTTFPSGVTDVKAIAAGYNHALALKEDGTVVAWGQNNNGETDVPSGLSDVVAISANYQHNLALKSDGTVVAWGSNTHGQTNVPSGLSNVTAIDAGFWHSLALKADGTVVAWGRNYAGQTNVPSGLTDVIAIAAAENYSLALKSDGTVVAWGTGGVYAVPIGLSNVVAISSGRTHSLALKSDGTVVAWGEEFWDETDVPSGLSDVAAISTKLYHNLVLKTDGTVVAWGKNNDGESTVPAEFRGSID